MRHADVFAILLLIAPVPALAQASGPATRPAGDTAAAAIRRLMQSPRDRKQWEAFKDHDLQDQAWPVLEAAVRNAKPTKMIGGFIRPEDDAPSLLEAMANINGPRSAGLVLEMARTATDPLMRCQAVWLIGSPLELKTPAARKVIRDALADPDGDVTVAALDSIARLGDTDAGPAVLEVLRHPPRKTWRGYRSNPGPHGELFDSALEALGGSSYADATDDLLGYTADPSAKVRSEAAGALAGCTAHDPDAGRHARAVERLAALLDDYNAAVRSAAAAALAGLGDKRAAPQLAFDLREHGTFDPAHPPAGYLYLYNDVKRLEKTTGADLGSALGADAWDLSTFDADAKRLAAVSDRVKRVLAGLKARGISADGLPRLPEALRAEDKAMFDAWFAQWLVDPRGAKLVSFEYPDRTCWGSIATGRGGGWLFPPTADKPARVVLTDGTVMPAPDRFDSIDLAADARRKVAAVSGPAPTTMPAEDEFDATIWHQRDLPSVDAACIEAAWLYRLGDETLAAQLLFIARGSGDTAGEALEQVLEGNAWSAFSAGVNAYAVRDDDAAQACLNRLREHYPKYLDQSGAGSRLLAELARRRAEGSFVAHGSPATMPADGSRRADDSQAPFKEPADFDRWPVERRVTWLIHELQEVDVRQQGQPGGVDVSADPRVEALVAMGDPAVPALIDCIDKDERLTRSMSFWRDFAHGRTIVQVRECALSAVESILGTSVFEPASTGDSFSARGDEQAHDTARRLRAYWDKYGKLPYAQRMMTVLTNPRSTPDATYSAASALAHANVERRFGTMVWTGAAKPKPGDNPVINQFKNPTVAEAILAAYERELAAFDKAAADKGEKPDDYRRDTLIGQYIDLLIDLQDRRIAPALLREYQVSTNAEDARRWALACYALAEERPMHTIAEGFEAGAFDLGKNDPKATDWFSEPGNRELTAWVTCLQEAGAHFCDDAIESLAAPNHPYHAAATELVRRLLVTEYTISDRDKVWLGQPVLFRLARPLLDDAAPSGRRYTVRNGDRLREEQTDGGGREAGLPEKLANPALRRDAVDARVCDVVALSLSRMVVGGPVIHPLFKDADARLEAFRKYIDRYGPQLRRLPYQWASAADMDRDDDGYAAEITFYPDVLVTRRLATADDVVAGRAVFALPTPGGTPGNRPLPMAATLTLPGRSPQKVLIMQAERAADGKMHYGVLGRHELREATDDQISDVKQIDAN